MKLLLKVSFLLLTSVLITGCGGSKSSTILEKTEPLITQEYRLDTGDLIRIEILGEAETVSEVRLDESGLVNYIQLPTPLAVNDKTLAEVKAELTSLLKPDYYLNPNVQVTILEYRPFFIYGHVNNPGAYPFQPGLNVAKAIALAGGETERADLDDIKVIRATDASETEVDIKMNSAVQPGDIIKVTEGFL